MIIKLFGLFDLLSGVLLLLAHFSEGFNTISRMSIGFIMYLFIKAYMFKGDFASFIDFLTGIYFVMILFGIKTFLTYIFALYLFQKAYFSLK